MLRGSTLTEAVRGHEWGELGDVVTDLRYGTSIKCSYGGSGPPVVRIPNVQNCTLGLSDLKFAIDANTDLSSYAVAQGDLLFVRTNGSRDLIGRVAVVDDADVVTEKGLRARLRPRVLAEAERL
ncbi:MAG: restriction endonuclease subunit S domain-containing protein [Solirubrobacteraceae bacterium]